APADECRATLVQSLHPFNSNEDKLIQSISRTDATKNVRNTPSCSNIETYSPGLKAWLEKRKRTRRAPRRRECRNGMTIGRSADARRARPRRPVRARTVSPGNGP